MTVAVTRLPLRLTPDPTRVITRFFCPGDVKRTHGIIDRVLSFPEPEVESLLADLEGGFRNQHPDLRAFFADHFEQVRGSIPPEIALSRERQLLIGACFTMDYALESVALFNPSMVPAMIQEGVQPGATRFLMSLRATGEGHISSIVFRTGIIDAGGDVRLDAAGTYARPLKASVPDRFRKSAFGRDLAAMGVPAEHFHAILDRLGERFSRTELGEAIDALRHDKATSGFLEESADTLISLSRVNYQLHLPHVPQVFRELEIVIFPFSDIERHGIEDLRLVRFIDDDATQVYYGTFTAYDGGRVYPKLLEYRGGSTIEISLLTGECAKNKDMALFPRRIRRKYAMISRIDNENLYYMESDDVLAWDQAQLIQAPKFAWQVIQLGNCGSPIETERGWLLMTHGVGPMRQYCIGATLLDRDDPCRVIAQTREPLLVPTDEERSGYVPNVVYSCGAMVHNGMLIVPYAMSDLATSVARINLSELLDSMKAS
jgi:predicted GH43/DUF377 family glycosyl hydrolase